MKRYCLDCKKRIWFFQDFVLVSYNQFVNGKKAYRIIHRKCWDREETEMLKKRRKENE